MTRSRLFAFAALLPLATLATAGPTADPAAKAPVPPPPGLNDPGVEPARDTAAHDAKGEPAPTVTVRQQGDDAVEEYRRGGTVYMIRIVPKNGVPQTFLDVDGDGRLDRDPREGPVAPVYYTLYQWD